VSIARYVCLWVGWLLPVAAVGASAPDTFEAWLADDYAAQQRFSAEVTRDYEAFLRQEEAAYEAFVREAEALWGRHNVWVPERTAWVQYTEELTERSTVDFDNGLARVEVLLEADTDHATVEKHMTEAVERLVLSGTEGPVQMFRRRLFGGGVKPEAVTHPYTVQKGDTLYGLSRRFKVDRRALAEANGLASDAWLNIGQVLMIPGDAPAGAVSGDTGKSILGGGGRMLQGQLRMADGKPVDRSNVHRYAKEVIQDASPQVTTIQGRDGKVRMAAATRFKLVSDHLRKRALAFRPLVLKYAREYGVYPPLVFAMIHTESSFNPRARSHAPAYGLMQLVPRSGARDAYRFVYQTDKLVSDDYLYDPERNIELGCAFVHLLQNRYLKAVQDPLSRLFCSVAAYNTGAGNVCRAFIDGRSVSRAAPLINAMPPSGVYVRLTTHLPYEETRHYVERVRTRMALYRDWE